MYQDRLGHLEELQLPFAPSVESDNFEANPKETLLYQLTLYFFGKP
jgi:hypothetical protein